MSDDRYLAWTLGNGTRGHNPIARSLVLTEALADQGNGQRGAVFAALTAAELETWKAHKMDVTAETWADAEPMMINADGDPIPERFVPARTKLEDQTVRILRDQAKTMQAQMVAFKAAAFSDVFAFMAELHALYRVSPAGKRGGVVLHAFDALSKVEISVADTLVFGPELASAKALIDECITAWSKDAKPELKVLVDAAFRVGGTGKIQVARVLELRRMEFKDTRWQEAMVAISDALRVQGSVQYIRFYTRPSQDAVWEMISLDMSRL